jgi:transcriptional regulator with XRE-family HTH domain
MSKILQQIRDSIEASEKSRYRISKETGIDQGHLSNLMKGLAGVSVEALEKLAECLNLEIVIRPRKKGK